MVIIRDILRSVTNFPVPDGVIDAVCLRRQVYPDQPASAPDIEARNFRLAEADILKWLYTVANMSQGGQSYTFTAEDKKRLKENANNIYRACGADDDVIVETGIKYGYKGDRL